VARLYVLALFTCCVAACSADDPPAETGWAAVRNPVLAYPDVAIKDAFMVQHEGRFHLGYSEASADPFRFRLGFASTADLREFTRGTTLDQEDTGGLASPDVTRAPDGRFVMTYNSHTRDVGTAASKLYYRTSSDLQTWSAATRIHVEGADADADRLIDAAMFFAPSDGFLFFKLDQKAYVAHASSLDGPWKLLGPLKPANLENYQPLRIDGRMHLLGTTIPLLHRPALHRLDGDENDPASWQTWTLVRELEIPEQSWNSGDPFQYERANAGYLVDARASDGFFYLLYAGSTDIASFNGRGHAKLGLARSTDLVHWEPPRAR
jgi:hypothetical protein